MMKIYEILAAKGNQVWSIASDQLVVSGNVKLTPLGN